ncbi:hypothetical protein Q3C01_39015 [Bradyrhizobium sp. UFLA05-109]
MPVLNQHFDPIALTERLRIAHVVTRPLMQDILDKACRRMPWLGRSEKAGRLTRLIDAEAWADAALALLELELPLWQVRRIVYDQGEWYCALSRERELPDWLDSSIETQHADLALALLSAFIEAQMLSAEATRPSVPSVRAALDPLYEPATCDNFS